MNAQANHCMAVDARGCGKVDNRTPQSSQAAERQGGGRSPGLRSGVVVGTPTIIASARHVPAKAQVLIVNLFLGWTFIGWVWRW